MRVSRRELENRNRRQAAQIERLLAERDEAVDNATAAAAQFMRLAAELSRAKDVIASHLVTAGHPSTVLHSVQEFRDALQQALADAGVDLRVELARMEGAQL